MPKKINPQMRMLVTRSSRVVPQKKLDNAHEAVKVYKKKFLEIQTENKNLREAIAVIEKQFTAYREANAHAYMQAERANEQRVAAEQILNDIARLIGYGDYTPLEALRTIDTKIDEYWQYSSRKDI